MPENVKNVENSLSKEANGCSSPARRKNRLNSESGSIKPSLLTMNEKNGKSPPENSVLKTSGGFPITSQAKLETNPFSKAISNQNNINNTISDNNTSKSLTISSNSTLKPSSSIFANKKFSFNSDSNSKSNNAVKTGFGALSSVSGSSSLFGNSSSSNAFAKMNSGGTSAWGSKNTNRRGQNNRTRVC